MVVAETSMLLSSALEDWAWVRRPRSPMPAALAGWARVSHRRSTWTSSISLPRPGRGWSVTSVNERPLLPREWHDGLLTDRARVRSQPYLAARLLARFRRA